MTGLVSLGRPVTRAFRAREYRRGGLRVLAAVLALGLIACSSSDDQSASKSKAERPVSYEAVDAISGKSVSLADLKGRPALLSSWATWCAPCRKELPRLERLHKAQGDDGLQVVIVNLDAPDKDEGAIKGMVDEFGLTMRQWRDSKDAFTVAFKGFGIPMSVLLDGSGKVVKKWYGAINPADEDVKGPIDKVLAGNRDD